MKRKMKRLTSILLIVSILLSNTQLSQAFTNNVKPMSQKSQSNSNEDTSEVDNQNQTDEVSKEEVQSEPQTEESISVETYEELQSEVANIQTESIEDLQEEDLFTVSDNDTIEVELSLKTLLVRSSADTIDTFGAKTVIQGVGNLYVLVYDTEKDTKRAYEKYKTMDSIVSVSYDMPVEISAATNVSNIENEGGNQPSPLKYHIDNLKDSSDVVVALIDSGVDLKNTLIKDRLVNSGFNYSSSGSSNAQDDHGHGTELANIIVTNSNSHVKLLPIKVANKQGKATLLNTYLAIQKAIEANVDVINLSLATVSTSETAILEAIINEATEKGIVVVVSAGNFGMDTRYFAPANIERAITVSATNESGVYSTYSNYGQSVDYSADGSYHDKTGTSYSTAYVSAIVAMLKTAEKGMTTTQIKEVLTKYAVDRGNKGYDQFYGNGFISLKELPSHNGGSSDDKEEIEKTLFNHDDWKSLSDDQLDAYIRDAEEYNLIVWIQLLADEDLSILITKDTILRHELIEYDYTSEEDEDGYRDVEAVKNIPYYKQLLNYDISELSLQAYSTLNGYFTLQINGADKTNSSIRIKTTTVNLDNIKQQKATFTIVTANTTNKHGFVLTKASSNTEKASTGSKNDWDGTEKVTSAEGKVTYRSKHYNIFALKGSYKKPAYTYASASVNYVDYASSRLNFEQYHWNNDYTSSLNNKGVNKSVVTEEVYISAEVQQTGNVYPSGKTPSHATLKINLAYPTLTVSYNANSGSASSSISTTNSVIKYDGSSSANLYKHSAFNLTREGYHTTEATAWKYGDVSYSQATSKKYKATEISDFTNGTKFSNKNVTMKASWEINTLTLKYNVNQGNVSSSSSLDITTYTRLFNYNAKNINLVDVASFGITRTGMHPKSGHEWYTTVSGTGGKSFNEKTTDYTILDLYPDIKTKTGQTLNLYVNWEPNTYNIKYNSNGGSGSLANTTHTYNVRSNLSANQFQRTGYDFGGWMKSSSNSVADFADTESVLNLTAVNGATFQLYALWKPKVFKIALEHEGGSSKQNVFYEKYSIGYFKDVSASSSITKLDVPTKAGHRFLGYYELRDGGGAQITDEKGAIKQSNTFYTKDSSAYAHWIEEFTVSYHKNTDREADVPDNQGKKHGETINLTANKISVKDEYYDSLYRFVGWNDKEDGSGTWYSKNQAYSTDKDLDLYAQWEYDVNIAYIGNEQLVGQDFTDESISVEGSYTFNDNKDTSGRNHYEKSIVKEFTDPETGETIEQEVSSTLVGWGFRKDVKATEEGKYKAIGEKIDTIILYKDAIRNGESVTFGSPNSEYGQYPIKSHSIEPTGFSLASISYDNNSLCTNGGKQTRAINIAKEIDVNSMPFINMYGVWDNGPLIEAYDVYYDLTFAQSTTASSGITKDLLLSQATATDDEDGELARKENASIGNGKSTSFTILDYSATDFSCFTAAGSVTIIFKAVDSVGNVTTKLVTVNIVDNRPSNDSNKSYTRFINEKYYNKDYELGGLEENSLWRTDEEYKSELEAAFSNMINNSPISSYRFSKEKIDQVKEFIKANGIGNLKSSDSLSTFYDEFMN